MHEVHPELLRYTREMVRRLELGRGGAPGRGGRGRRGAGAVRAPDIVERLDREGLLPAILFIFSRAGCDAAVQQCLAAGLRLTTPDERAEIRRVVEARTAAHPRRGPDVLGYWEWLDGLERGLAAHHAGHAARVQGGRRGAVRPRPGQGGLRHRDAGAGHQHAGPVRGAGAAGQVQRRGARRPDAGGVHPAHRAGRPARHRRRGARGRGLVARRSTRGTSPGWPRPAPTRCGRASGRRTTWRSTWSASVGAEARPRAAGVARSRSSRPTGRWSAWPGRCSATRRRMAGVRRVDGAATSATSPSTSRSGAAIAERETALARQGAAQRRAAAVAVAGAAAGRRRDPGAVGRRAGLAVVLDPGVGRLRRAPPAGAHRGPVGRPARRRRLPDPGRGAGPGPGAQALQPPLPAGAPRPGLRAAQRRGRSDAPRRRGRAARRRAARTSELARLRARAAPAPVPRLPGPGGARPLGRAARAGWSGTPTALRQQGGEPHRLARPHLRPGLRAARPRAATCAPTGEVTDAGRMLARIWTEADLLVAECLRARGLGRAGRGRAGRGGVRGGLRGAPGGRRARRRCRAGPVRDAVDGDAGSCGPSWRPTRQRHGLALTREPDLGFVWPIYRWARGESLAEVLGQRRRPARSMPAGDFVRWARRCSTCSASSPRSAAPSWPGPRGPRWPRCAGAWWPRPVRSSPCRTV